MHTCQSFPSSRPRRGLCLPACALAFYETLDSIQLKNPQEITETCDQQCPSQQSAHRGKTAPAVTRNSSKGKCRGSAGDIPRTTPQGKRAAGTEWPTHHALRSGAGARRRCVCAAGRRRRRGRAGQSPPRGAGRGHGHDVRPQRLLRVGVERHPGSLEQQGKGNVQGAFPPSIPNITPPLAAVAKVLRRRCAAAVAAAHPVTPTPRPRRGTYSPPPTHTHESTRAWCVAACLPPARTP